jgi:chromosome segregation ATPase
MLRPPSIDALRTALEPVEALRGEHSQLEASVRDSFAALEALHNELSEWQRELTREQAQLDQREAKVNDAEAAERHAEIELMELRRQFAESRQQMQQLEAENAEQLQAMDDLDRQLSISQAELRTVRKHSHELTVAFETERERGADEHRHWTSELKEMRRLMERQGTMLERLAGTPKHDGFTAPRSEPTPAYDDSDGDDNSGDADEVASRAAELLRRAKSRRGAPPHLSGD